MSRNPYSLDSKTILVTGASSGIGAATAVECSRLGAKVIVTGRDEAKLKEVFGKLEGDGHAYYVADLCDDDQLNMLVEKAPVLDGLVNNAGITKATPVSFISKSAIDNILDINTIAPVLLNQKLLKSKKIARGCSIVYTCSISGVYVAANGISLYSMSKGAISGFVKNAALELASREIRVNCVCPGQIDTHLNDVYGMTEEQVEAEKHKYPLRRFGKPEEIAYGIIYLLSDASSFVTGSNLVIDGGFTLQ